LSKICRAVACRIPNILNDIALENMKKKTSEDFKDPNFLPGGIFLDH
jgi:hypothetical protein